MSEAPLVAEACTPALGRRDAGLAASFPRPGSARRVTRLSPVPVLTCWGWVPRETRACRTMTNPNCKQSVEGTWAGRHPRDPVPTWQSRLLREKVGDAHGQAPRRVSCGNRLSPKYTASVLLPPAGESGAKVTSDFPQNPFCRLGPDSENWGRLPEPHEALDAVFSLPDRDKPAENAGTVPAHPSTRCHVTGAPGLADQPDGASGASEALLCQAPLQSLPAALTEPRRRVQPHPYCTEEEGQGGGADPTLLSLHRDCNACD